MRLPPGLRCVVLPCRCPLGFLLQCTFVCFHALLDLPSEHGMLQVHQHSGKECTWRLAWGHGKAAPREWAATHSREWVRVQRPRKSRCLGRKQYRSMDHEMRVEMGVGRGQAWYLLLPVQTCNIRCSFVGNAGEGGIHKNGSLAGPLSCMRGVLRRMPLCAMHKGGGGKVCGGPPWVGRRFNLGSPGWAVEGRTGPAGPAAWGVCAKCPGAVA